VGSRARDRFLARLSSKADENPRQRGGHREDTRGRVPTQRKGEGPRATCHEGKFPGRPARRRSPRSATDDQRFPCHRHDRDPSRAPLQRTDALTELRGECAFRLIAQPEPGKLDHGRACSRVAGSADAPVTIQTTALVGHRCNGNIAGELTTVAERAVECLADQLHPRRKIAQIPLAASESDAAHCARLGATVRRAGLQYDRTTRDSLPLLQPKP